MANIFLHEVIDDWFAKVVKPRVGPAARMVRYADDILVIVQTEKEAQRVQAATRSRFAKFGLEHHPVKSKIVDFTRPPWKGSPKGSKPGSFNFLGFTFYWGKSLRGAPAIMNKTLKESFRAGLKEILVFWREEQAPKGGLAIQQTQREAQRALWLLWQKGESRMFELFPTSSRQDLEILAESMFATTPPLVDEVLRTSESQPTSKPLNHPSMTTPSESPRLNGRMNQRSRTATWVPSQSHGGLGKRVEINFCLGPAEETL